MNEMMTSGVDEMGEVMAGSVEEYTDSMRLLSDHDLDIEIRSSIPNPQQHAIAITEYNRRIVAKEKDRQSK